MPPVGFEPTILVSVRPKTHALDRTITGIGIQSIKLGYSQLPSLFNFALECVIKKVQKNREGLELNRTHELPGYADDINFMGTDIKVHKFC